MAILSVLFLIFVMVRYRREETSPEWIEARQYADAKGLSQEQWLTLSAMLKRFATAGPFEAITYRHEFDRCVRDQMNAIKEMAPREKMGEALREIREALELATVPEGARWSSTLDLEEKQTVKARPVEQDSSPMHEFYIKHVNDAFFYLTPRHSDIMKEMPVGSRHVIHACHPGDARYEVIAEVADARESPAQVVFGHVFEIKRLQARAHERSAYTLPTPVDMFVVPEENAHDPLPWLYNNDPMSQGTGTFMNLSAGGYAAMLHAAPPPNRAYARVTVTLGREDFPPFTVFSRIVGTVALAENRTLVRAAFVDITPRQKEAIERYVQQTLQQEQEDQTAPEGA